MSLWIPSQALLAGDHPPRGEGRRACRYHSPEGGDAPAGDGGGGAAAARAASVIPDPRARFRAAVAGESVHDFAVRDVQGGEVALDRYAGRVLLVVNTATLSPNAAQFLSLESLQQKYGERGLRVLAFPSHSFGGEPRREADIEHLVRTRYRATFDLFAKVAVHGPDQSPLYAFLTNRDRHHEFGGAIDNDFAKFLIDGAGRVVARFPAAHDPLSREVVAAVEAATSPAP